MPRTVRIHIGPMKSGSSTIQSMLWGQRERMYQSGYLFPEPAPGPKGHSSPVLDFLNGTSLPIPPMSPFLTHWLAHRNPRRAGAWQRLVGEIAEFPGDAVISSEMLHWFSADLVEQFCAGLPADRIEVYAVRRRPSYWLPSWFQESVKRYPLPDFETFARQALATLAHPQPAGFNVIDHRRLSQAWSSSGSALRWIDARSGLTDDVIERTVKSLTPGMSWQAPAKPVNSGMSAFGTEVWRRHMQRGRGRYVATQERVRLRMLATYPATASGPKLRLTPEAARWLDDFSEGRTSQPPPTNRLTEPIVAFQIEVNEILSQLQRWQLIADAKAELVQTVNRARGRPRSIRAVRSSSPTVTVSTAR